MQKCWSKIEEIILNKYKKELNKLTARMEENWQSIDPTQELIFPPELLVKISK
jgi:hypothetical protein